MAFIRLKPRRLVFTDAGGQPNVFPDGIFTSAIYDLNGDLYKVTGFGGNPYRMLWVDGSGTVSEFGLAPENHFLQSGGPTSAPKFSNKVDGGTF